MINFTENDLAFLAEFNELYKFIIYGEDNVDVENYGQHLKFFDKPSEFFTTLRVHAFVLQQQYLNLPYLSPINSNILNKKSILHNLNYIVKWLLDDSNNHIINRNLLCSEIQNFLLIE